MYINNKDISGVFVGAQEVSSAYMGTVEIYAKNQPIPSILYYCWRGKFMPEGDYFYCYTNVKPVTAGTTLYFGNGTHNEATDSSQLVSSSTPGNITNITSTSFKIPDTYLPITYNYYSTGDLYS